MRLRDEVPALALAAQFLTRLPVRAPWSDAAMARAPIHFPLVGLGIGLATAAVLWVASLLLPPLAAALIAILAGVLLTGGLHEDGLADTMDGLGGRDSAHTLEIMRDSRIGTHGVLALIFSLGLRSAILGGLLAHGPALAAAALIVGHAGSRLSMLAVMATSPYLRETGAGSGMKVGLWPDLGLAGLPALAAILLLPPSAWLPAILGLCLGHGAARLSFRRLGGHTGDCLGAVQQISEVGLGLAVLAWAG